MEKQKIKNPLSMLFVCNELWWYCISRLNLKLMWHALLREKERDRERFSWILLRMPVLTYFRFPLWFKLNILHLSVPRKIQNLCLDVFVWICRFSSPIYRLNQFAVVRAIFVGWLLYSIHSRLKTQLLLPLPLPLPLCIVNIHDDSSNILLRYFFLHLRFHFKGDNNDDSEFCVDSWIFSSNAHRNDSEVDFILWKYIFISHLLRGGGGKSSCRRSNNMHLTFWCLVES